MNDERNTYFKNMLDILIVSWYFIITKTERLKYFKLDNEMNFTSK